MAWLSASPAAAHVGAHLAQVPAAPDPSIRVEKVGEDTYCLFGKGGNVGVVVTPGAILVVDTQYEDIAPALLAGHGPVGGPAELRSFRSYLVDLHETVGAARGKGQTLSTALDEIRLDSHADLKPGLQSLQSNILQVWEELDSRGASP